MLVCVIVFKHCPANFNPLSLISFLEIFCNHTCLVVDKTCDINLKIRSDLFVLVIKWNIQIRWINSPNGIYTIHGLSLFSSDLTPAAGRNISHNFPVPWYYLGCSLFVSPAAATILFKMWPGWGRPNLCVAD